MRSQGYFPLLLAAAAVACGQVSSDGCGVECGSAGEGSAGSTGATAEGGSSGAVAQGGSSGSQSGGAFGDGGTDDGRRIAMLFDFEDQDPTHLALFEDGTGTFVSGPEVPIEEIPGGRGDSRYALHVVMEGYTSWGGGALGVLDPAVGYVDTSQFDGLTLWARGTSWDSRVEVALGTPETEPVELNGECVDACHDRFKKRIVLEPEWREYFLPWSELRQSGWGTPATFDGRVMTVFFALGQSSGPAHMDVWIDDVGFYAAP